MNHSSSTLLNTFLIKLLFHCGVGIYLDGLFYIKFSLPRDKSQVLFISVSAVPSTRLRKQWMLNRGLLMARRQESVSERKIEKACWETKLESSTWNKMVEFRIFISSDAGGYNLNFMKRRKEEMQANTLKSYFLTFQAQTCSVII